MDIDPSLRFAGYPTPDNIADPQNGCALFLGFAEGGKRIGSLAALADHEHDILGADDGVPVTELGGIINFHRNPRELFDHIFPGESGMPGSSAGCNDDPRRVKQLIKNRLQPPELRSTFVHLQSSAQGIGDRLRLLVDLLEQEMLIAALLDLLEIKGNLLD